MNVLRCILTTCLISGLAAVQLSAQDKSSAMLTSPAETASAFLPDTVPATQDSLQTDIVLNPCQPDPNTLNMKIYIPDSTLTESMPVYGGSEVDEGIFIPKLLPCVGAQQLQSDTDWPENSANPDDK